MPTPLPESATVFERRGNYSGATMYFKETIAQLITNNNSTTESSDTKFVKFEKLERAVAFTHLGNYSPALEIANEILKQNTTNLEGLEVKSQVTEDQQIEIMKTNLQTSGQLTGLSGKPYEFYKQIDVADFLKYLIGRYSEHTAKCYLSYFDKYSTIFFSTNPHTELLKLTAHKRSWILQAIKRFGDYYYRKYNNREVVQLIREIIERYELNRDLDMKDRIYLVSPQFVEEKVKKVFDLPGEIGFTSRLGLVTGLREQELLYIKEKPVCSNGHDCDCENLHLVSCENGMTIIAIGWTRGNKKAL
jgi:tetratricopeptide (TPR) repeat protein